MKILAIAISMSVLVGCSVDNSDNCSSFHNYTNEQTDSNGLVLTPSQNMHATFEQVSSYYGETMSCMGMTATGPEVWYKSFEAYFGHKGGWAIYHPGGVVIINTDDDIIPGIVRDCQTDKEALKHEFIHHILNMNDVDWSHTSPMFVQCGVGVNTYN